MLDRIFGKVRHYREISLIKFLYYNFLCKKIVRKKSCYLIPYKNSRIQLGKGAKIILNGNLSIGINKVRGSKAETYIRLADNAEWVIEDMAVLYFNVHIEVHKNARLVMGHCGINSGSVIVCSRNISIGNYVMLGRNILIYDSDHHDILDDVGNVLNSPKEVIIGNHVWLTSNITILKGAKIGDDSIVTAYTSISKDMPRKSLIGGSPAKVIKEAGNWIWDLQ